MKTKTNHHLVHIPLEFRIACSIYKLNPQQVLQIFINHATVYDSLADGYSEGFSECSKTIGLCVVSLRRTANGSHAYDHCLESTALNFKGIHEIAKRQIGSAAAKRKSTLAYIDELYATMERVYTKSDILYLDENTTLHFTKDFTVMCELHNCYPAEYLENFMSRISLAEMEAKTGLGISNDNFTMAFFMKIVLGFGMVDEEVPNLNAAEIAFVRAATELRVRMFTVRSLPKRISVFKELYHNRYEQIINQN